MRAAERNVGKIAVHYGTGNRETSRAIAEAPLGKMTRVTVPSISEIDEVSGDARIAPEAAGPNIDPDCCPD